VDRAKQSHVRHYMVVTACAILVMLAIGIPFSSAGIFFAVVPADIGVPLSAMSLWMTINGLLSTAVLPKLGTIMAKRDARIVLSGSLASVALALAIFSLGKSGDPRAVYWFYIGAVFVALGSALPIYLAVPTLINRWFADKAAMFLGIAVSFTGIGGVVFNPVGQALISSLGWQDAYRALALIVLCGIPFMWLLVRSFPSDVGLLPYGADKVTNAASDTAPKSVVLTGVSAAVATKTTSFKLLCLLSFFSYFGITAYQLMAKYAGSLPLAAGAAGVGAILSSCAMAGQAIGKIGLGAISDRSVRLGSTVSLGCGFVALTVLWLFPVAPTLLYVAGFMFGWYYAFSMVQLPSLARAVFGVREFAQIYSKIGTAGAFAGAIAMPVLSVILEKSGSWPVVFIVVMSVIVVSFLVVISALRSGEGLEHTTN
jgi:MFS family permease